MNKGDLITTLANRNNISKNQSEEILHSLLEIIEESVEAGIDVAIQNFGCFKLIERKARQGYNPKNKEPMAIPAHKAVVFKPGARFKERVK